MKIENLMVWEIFVPSKVPFEMHLAWDAKVMEITRGLTIKRSVRGKWLEASGLPIKESMIPVSVACSRYQIEQIAEITKEHYGQDAVFVTLVSDTAFILS